MRKEENADVTTGGRRRKKTEEDRRKGLISNFEEENGKGHADIFSLPTRKQFQVTADKAGVDIATIALWLGHESIETTHVYLQADLAMQEKALEKLDPLEGEWQRFQADDPLLTFLNSL